MKQNYTVFQIKPFLLLLEENCLIKKQSLRNQLFCFNEFISTELIDYVSNKFLSTLYLNQLLKINVLLIDNTINISLNHPISYLIPSNIDCADMITISHWFCKIYSLLTNYLCRKYPFDLTAGNKRFSMEFMKVKLLMNCRFVIVIRNKMENENIINKFLENCGNISQFDHVKKIIYIISSDSFDFQCLNKQTYVLPNGKYEHVFDKAWIEQCLDSEALMNLNNYRIITVCKLANSNENLALDYQNIRKAVSNSVVTNNFGCLLNETDRKKIIEKKLKRIYVIYNLKAYLISKINTMQNFLALQNNILLQIEEIQDLFVAIKFIKIFFSKLHATLSNGNIDGGIKFYEIFKCIGDYFTPYNDTFQSIRKLEVIINNKYALRKIFEIFCKANNLTNISLFFYLPITSIMTFGPYFNEILKNTHSHHPDIRSWYQVQQKNIEVLKYFNIVEDDRRNAVKQCLISKCLHPVVISHERYRFWTAVDCMLTVSNSLPCPITLFLFKETIMICKFADPKKPLERFEKIKHKLQPSKSLKGKLSFRKNSVISNCNKSPVPINFKNLSQFAHLDIPELNEPSLNNPFIYQLSKFNAVFTGLSKLDWNKIVSGGYISAVEIPIRQLLSVTSEYFSGNNIFDKLCVTLELSNSDKIIQKINLRLIPIIMNRVGDYSKRDITLPEEIKWEPNNYEINLSVEDFILEEKNKFCHLLDQLIQRTRNLNSDNSSKNSANIFQKRSYKTKENTVEKPKLKRRSIFQKFMKTIEPACKKFKSKIP